MNSHVCPASHAGLLANSFRRLFQNPEKILKGLVEPGQTVADIGCGPGFFTLPMARMVGKKGEVIAADLQQEMLEKVRGRAEKAPFMNNIRYHLCKPHCIGIREKVDFILAFYMVHETPDARAFFAEARNMIKPGGSLFYVEPKFHVSRKEFNGMIQEAEYSGWLSNGAPPLSMSHTALLC